VRYDRQHPRPASWAERRAIQRYLRDGGDDSNWGDGSYLTWRGNVFTGRWLERSRGGTIKEWVAD
jgi:hypothetical protein